MARDHARIKLSMWADPEWRSLKMSSQWLYQHLLGSPTLGYAGNADWRPKRIAHMCGDGKANYIEYAAVQLEERHFVIIDRDTEEALVRSFVRHDGLLHQPNVAIAAVKAWEGMASEVLRGVFAHEINRLMDDQADAAAWTNNHSAARLDDVLSYNLIKPEEAVALLPPNPAWDDFYEAESNPSVKGSGKGSR